MTPTEIRNLIPNEYYMYTYKHKTVDHKEMFGIFKFIKYDIWNPLSNNIIDEHLSVKMIDGYIRMRSIDIPNPWRESNWMNSINMEYLPTVALNIYKLDYDEIIKHVVICAL